MISEVNPNTVSTLLAIDEIGPNRAAIIMYLVLKQIQEEMPQEMEQMSQNKMALILKMTRPTIAKACQVLVRKGIMEKTRKKVKIICFSHLNTV